MLFRKGEIVISKATGLRNEVVKGIKDSKICPPKLIWLKSTVTGSVRLVPIANIEKVK